MHIDIRDETALDLIINFHFQKLSLSIRNILYVPSRQGRVSCSFLFQSSRCAVLGLNVSVGLRCYVSNDNATEGQGISRHV